LGPVLPILLEELRQHIRKAVLRTEIILVMPRVDCRFSEYLVTGSSLDASEYDIDCCIVVYQSQAMIIPNITVWILKLENGRKLGRRRTCRQVIVVFLRRSTSYLRMPGTHHGGVGSHGGPETERKVLLGTSCLLATSLQPGSPLVLPDSPLAAPIGG
jgi:hypothetical protein